MAATNGGSSESDLPPARAGDQSPESEPNQAAVRTFLIADVRGYTRFTQEHGDEEAGRLAAAFARMAREAVESQGGEVIELRGDEALCVFASARQATRAAVELQRTFRRRTESGPEFPLPIGVGLDAGEAIPIEGGYRGGALNTAARLCSIAGPGRILATDTVVSLARRLEGIRFIDRRPVRLKGLEKPVRVVEVVPEVELPPLPELSPTRRPLVTRRRLIMAATTGVALIGAIVALVVGRSSGAHFLPRLGANAIGVIDADAAGVTAEMNLDSRPAAIAAGGGFVWVASEADDTLSRIDPETRALRTLSLGEAANGVAYGVGAVWVTSSESGTVAQIKPATLTVVQRIAVGNGPGPIAVGEGAVWVANTVDGTVSRIDLDRGGKPDTIRVGESPAGIAIGAGAVWITSEANGEVLRLEPRSGKIVQAVNVGNRPTGIAVGEGAVWVTNRQDGTVSRIDPETNSVAETLPVGTSPVSLAVGSGSIWVANGGDGTIDRIDPDSRDVESVAVESSPNALVLAAGNVWAVTLESLRSHRGGVLRAESGPFVCRCIDPAASYLYPEGLFMPLVYDGLLGYRRVGGIAGGALLGDLAVAVPSPTDGGRTYALQLRRGIRFSNGALVRPSDFRYSLERLLAINPDSSFYFGGIVGASECSAGSRKPCDLSKGIEVDDGARTITIHLAKLDPDFPYKLALPLAAVVPTGTPLRIAREEPIPGTGPYRIASIDRDLRLRLVRNTRFRVWSADVRPDGYPDELRFDPSGAETAQVAAVERGKADWANPAPSEALNGVVTSYAARFHTDPSNETDFMFLNTRAPPFDDVRVRQALNYATDRNRLVDLIGGRVVARPTCQLVPPAFPGYRPYCPYTRDPNSAGTWTAPDLAKARALVAASGTRGMHVAVVAYSAPDRVAIARYVASLLRKLGYRSSVRIFSDTGAYFAFAADSRSPTQIGVIGWYSDFAAASNFLQTLFACSAFVPNDPGNKNYSRFCDREVDRRIGRAASVQRVDAVRANSLWAQVDRALVDSAAVVPLLNRRNTVLVSARVGNYQNHPQWGTLLDELWVK